ncbi:uroporphyrinogen decarboxylase family protein [Candidatus Chlorohelix sp.]|uniref:uroporphyrinogen decarboxylase family protein n=1 Tax=Candidatus Chlorohelix sp. TaxID=3139201 RepID=UPI00303F0522
MAKSEKWKRVETALSGGQPDRVPYAFWKHFPVIDKNPDELVKATAEFHRKFEQDFVKVMFRSSFTTEDWGFRPNGYHPTAGNLLITDYVIKTPQDWRRLELLDPTQGTLGEQLIVLRKLAKELDGDAPILSTVFSPSMIGLKLAGEEGLAEHLKADPEAVKAGLSAIAETVLKFGEATLKNGADGLFYAIQEPGRILTAGDGQPNLGDLFDRPVLEKLFPSTGFFFLHAHGETIAFEEIVNYSYHALNWHDRGGGPSLKEARRFTNKTLAGGLNNRETLPNGTPADVAAEVTDAVNQLEGRGLLLTPGCGFPVNAPEDNLLAVKETIQGRLALA